MPARPPTCRLACPGLIRSALLGLGGCLLALGVLAATVRAPDAPLLPQGSAGSSTLERALSLDASTGPADLDLLLDARSAADDAPAGATPGARRLQARRPTLPQVLVDAATAEPGQPPLPAALGLQAGDGSAAPPVAGGQREWLGAAPAGLAGGSTAQGLGYRTMAAGTDFGPARGADDAARKGPDAEIPAALRELLLFLREQRFWLLGGLALVAAIVAGLQAYARRP